MSPARETACAFIKSVSLNVYRGAGVCFLDLPVPMHCPECDRLTAAIEQRDREVRAEALEGVRAALERTKTGGYHGKHGCSWTGATMWEAKWVCGKGCPIGDALRSLPTTETQGDGT